MLLVLCALGCKPMYSPGYAGGGYGGDYGYDYYSDAESPLADEELATEADYKKAERRYRAEAQGAPSQTVDTATTGTEANHLAEPEPPPKPPEPDDPSPQTRGRQIIYTAGIGLSVFDVDDVMARLEAIPERHGGWLHQRFDNRVVLRVPAAKLQAIIDEIGEWGVVEWKTLEALDVTAQYTDLDSRIRVLEQMQGHLQALLARAESVEQALEIQVELSRITTELELLRAQMRMLDSSIAFSTLAVDLRERSTTVAEPSNDPFPWVDQLGAEATAYR